MEYRKLGRTGIEISTYSLGTMMLGSEGNSDRKEGVRIVHQAIDAGINLVDTADVYSFGESEEIVGEALVAKRDEIVLATKVHGAMGPGPNKSGNSRRWIMQALDRSLQRLQTDWIDIYQIHRPDPNTDLDETLSALTDLVRSGKVRYAGCSSFPAHHIVEAQWVSERGGYVRFVCEQPQYSILAREAEHSVFDVVQGHDMGALVWSPLAGGWLTGKYRRGRRPPGDSRAARMAGEDGPAAKRYILADDSNETKFSAIEALEGIAEKAGLPLTHLALNWTLHHPAVTSTILGPRTSEHLADLLSAADVRLTSDVLDAIDGVVPPGTMVSEPDRGWLRPWLAASARRRAMH